MLSIAELLEFIGAANKLLSEPERQDHSWLSCRLSQSGRLGEGAGEVRLLGYMSLFLAMPSSISDIAFRNRALAARVLWCVRQAARVVNL